MAAKNAIFNYYMDGTYCMICGFSIESGPYAIDVDVASGEVPAIYYDTSASPVRASFSAGIVNGETLQVHIADTSGTPAIYRARYTNNNGSIDIDETNVSTAINELTLQ